MEGLDNYLTEGGRAFDLEKLVLLLPEKTQQLKQRLKDAKQYLKTDMKVSTFYFKKTIIYFLH